MSGASSFDEDAPVLQELSESHGEVSTVKEELLRLIEGQPDDSTLDEIAQALALNLMVQRGLADAGAGRVITDEEMAQRIKSWAK